MTEFLIPITVNVLPAISELQNKQGMFILPDGSININKKDGTWMIINKQSDHAGILKPSGTVNTQPGVAKWYWAGPGTYSNIAPGIAIDRAGIISYDGTKWDSLNIEIPNSKIQTWIPQGYFAGDQVINSDDSGIYEAIDSVISTDVPGISNKWKKKVGLKVALEFDPTNNNLPSSMKAAAVRYDKLLEVNKGFLEKRPPNPEVPKNINEATFATFGGLFLRNDNTYEINGNYPNIGLVFNMDVSNAYRLETTGMVPIGDNNRPAILGIKNDGTISTILYYTDAGFTGLKKLDVSAYEKVTIQVVKGQYPTITLFEYDENSVTDAKNYIDDAIDSANSEYDKALLISDYFLSDGASYANEDSTNWTKQLFSWASKSMYPFPTSNFKSKDIEIPEPAKTVNVVTYNKSVGDNASWKAIIGRKIDGSYIVLEESVAGSGIEKIEREYDVDALELQSIIVNNFADGGEASIKFVGSNVVEKDAIKNYIDEKSQASGFSNYIYKKKGSAISDITNDVNSTTGFVLGSNGVTIKSRGANTGLLLQKRTNLGSRCFEIRTTLYTDTVMYMGTRALENSLTGDNMFTLDFATKKYKNYMNSAVYGEGDINMTITNGRVYIIRYSKMEEYDKLEIVDTLTGANFTVKMISFFQYDLYKTGQIAGVNDMVITEMSLFALLKDRPLIGFYGDSIIEGDEVRYVDPNSSYKDRFATLIGDGLGKPYYVSGRQGGTVIGLMERMRVEIPYLRPKYVYIQIGTNGQNTIPRLNEMVDFCQSMGCIVILCTVTVHGSSTAINEMILNVVNDKKLRCVRHDLATSVNGDGVTKDLTKFAPGGNYIHPNAFGNKSMYERARIDIEDIFVSQGTLV